MNEIKETAGETATTVKGKEELMNERKNIILGYGELQLNLEGLQSQYDAIRSKMAEVKELLVVNTKAINDIIVAEKEVLPSETD